MQSILLRSSYNFGLSFNISIFLGIETFLLSRVISCYETILTETSERVWVLCYDAAQTYKSNYELNISSRTFCLRLTSDILLLICISAHKRSEAHCNCCTTDNAIIYTFSVAIYTRPAPSPKSCRQGTSLPVGNETWKWAAK